MVSSNEVERVQKALRAQLGLGATVMVAAAELRLLLDEVGRLQQSSDRLRRQNRRVRLKLQKAGLVDEATDESDPPK